MVVTVAVVCLLTWLLHWSTCVCISEYGSLNSVCCAHLPLMRQLAALLIEQKLAKSNLSSDGCWKDNCDIRSIPRQSMLVWSFIAYQRTGFCRWRQCNWRDRLVQPGASQHRHSLKLVAPFSVQCDCMQDEQWQQIEQLQTNYKNLLQQAIEALYEECGRLQDRLMVCQSA